MIVIRLSDHDDASRLVAACLVAAGHDPQPDGADAEEYQRLADELGDGLDELPVPGGEQ